MDDNVLTVSHSHDLFSTSFVCNCSLEGKKKKKLIGMVTS
jgi:hypothetical protein